MSNKSIRKSLRQLVVSLAAQEDIDSVLRIIDHQKGVGRRLPPAARDAAIILTCKVSTYLGKV